jgi:hypothetical protein
MIYGINLIHMILSLANALVSTTINGQHSDLIHYPAMADMLKKVLN